MSKYCDSLLSSLEDEGQAASVKNKCAQCTPDNHQGEPESKQECKARIINGLTKMVSDQIGQLQAGSSKLLGCFGHKGSIKHLLHLFDYQGEPLIKPAYCTTIMVRLEIDTELAVSCENDLLQSCTSVKDIVVLRQ